MEKIILLSLVLLLLIPLVAVADMSGPILVSYEAYVSNPNGADYYDYKLNKAGTLSFKEKVVAFDYDWEDLQNAYNGIMIQDSVFYILKTDITIDKLDQYSLGEIEEYTVVPNSCNIYDIPNDIFDNQADIQKHIIGEIPALTTIKCQKYIGGVGVGDGDWSNWVYTSYNGINGWVNYSDLGNKEEGEFYFTSDTKTKSGKLIPMFTKYETIYYGNGYNYDSLYALIDNDFVYLDCDDDPCTKVEKPFAVLTEDPTALYEQGNGQSKVLMTIPEKSRLICIYIVEGFHGESWRYVKYDNTYGWVFRIPFDYEYNNELTQDELKDALAIQKSIEDNLNKSKELNEEKNVENVVTNDNNQENLAVTTDSEKTEKSAQQENETIVDTISQETDNDIGISNISNYQDATKPKEDTVSLILICLSCAVVGAVTATILVLLINSKKK